MEDTILAKRTKGLVIVRLALIILLLTMEAFVWQTPRSPFFILMAVFILLSIFYYLWQARGRDLRALSYLQIVADMVLVTALIHYTRGIDSIYVFLYPLVIIEAGSLLDRKAILITASLGALFYASLIAAEHYRQPVRSLEYISYLVSFRLIVFYLIALLSGQLTESHRQTGKELHQLRSFTQALLFKDLTKVKDMEEKIGQVERLAATAETATGIVEEIGASLDSLLQAGKALNREPLEKNGQRLTNHIVKTAERLKGTVARHLFVPEDRDANFSDIAFEPNLVGRSEKMQEVYRQLEKVARTDSTVIVYGESGTGKELVARAIHHRGRRRDKPFIALDCGALPETLLESELFGHVKGAFTGAFQARKGLFEVAEKGTLFLDEVATTTANIQMKLLRVLQERELRPVGGTGNIKVDVRIIAATNRDLEQAIREGTFREDLFYRLSVIPLHLPPLRERREDITLLVKHFVNKLSGKTGSNPKEISPEAMEFLCRYRWPGNIRELENVIERVLTLSSYDSISPDDLPKAIRDNSKADVFDNGSLREQVEKFERELILETLRVSQGNKYQAAKKLGVSRQDLQYKIKKHGLTLVTRAS